MFTCNSPYTLGHIVCAYNYYNVYYKLYIIYTLIVLIVQSEYIVKIIAYDD